MDEVDGSKSRQVNRLSIDGDCTDKSFPCGLDLFSGKTVYGSSYIGGIAESRGAHKEAIFFNARCVKQESAILVAGGDKHAVDRISRLDHVNGGACGRGCRAGGE